MTLPSRITRRAVALVACAVAVTLWSADAIAQRRGRPVRGRVTVVAAPHIYRTGGYWPRYYGRGFYDPFLWGGYPGWYPFGWYGPYGPYGPYGRMGYGYRSGPTGSARLQVTPREAEVYVDGNFTGTVDNFDGLLQRLDVPAGPHTLTFHLEGYTTVTQRVLFREGATINISYAMARLAQGETTEPPPAAVEPPAPAIEEAPESRPAPPRARDREARASTFGTLALRVQPDDATIVVDGEEWTFSEGRGPLQLELSEGEHEVEIRKDGLTTYRTTVRVRRGEVTPLNVSLVR